LLAASTAAEVGRQGSKAEQYYIESVFNRAAARDMSIQTTVTDNKYYPSTTLNKLDKAVESAVQARIDKIIENVIAGSNESNFATGNESGDVHCGGAPVTRDVSPGKERFVRELPDLKWIKRMEAAAARRRRRIVAATLGSELAAPRGDQFRFPETLRIFFARCLTRGS
jgi:hypothetical protein